jgi:hypothetical protein
MSAAFVSGVIALLLEENPALTPDGVKTLLHDTARHRFNSGLPCGATNPFGIDARYHTGWGFGEVDAYAAYTELHQANQTQFVQLSATWNAGLNGVDVSWSTQREKNISGFEVQRAPDVSGAPGTFIVVGSEPGLGSPNLVPVNRTTYVFSDAAPQGALWWYRIKTVGGNTFSPLVQVRSETPSAWARVALDHNTAETDLALTLGTGIPQTAPAWQQSVTLLTTLDAVTVSGPSDLLSYSLSVPTYGNVGNALPPGPSSPWWIRAVEGGGQRTGLLRDFALAEGTTLYETDSSTPKTTVEGKATSLWIPEPATVGIPGDANLAHLVASPNPFRSTTTIDLAKTTGFVRVSIHDVSGRQVLELWRGNGTGGHITWDGRDAKGVHVPAGTYFVRIEDQNQVRALELVRLP